MIARPEALRGIRPVRRSFWHYQVYASNYKGYAQQAGGIDGPYGGVEPAELVDKYGGNYLSGYHKADAGCNNGYHNHVGRHY